MGNKMQGGKKKKKREREGKDSAEENAVSSRQKA
jgi:hypothetical protein